MLSLGNLCSPTDCACRCENGASHLVRYCLCVVRDVKFMPLVGKALAITLMMITFSPCSQLVTFPIRKAGSNSRGHIHNFSWGGRAVMLSSEEMMQRALTTSLSEEDSECTPY